MSTHAAATPRSGSKDCTWKVNGVLSSVATNRMSLPLSCASPKLKLPVCRRMSTGTRPAASAMFAPLGVVSMVSCLRYDQSVCHHASAWVGASTRRTSTSQPRRQAKRAIDAEESVDFTSELRLDAEGDTRALRGRGRAAAERQRDVHDSEKVIQRRH